jgi:fucose 4-O-acetylase-like acetyltransferase
MIWLGLLATKTALGFFNFPEIYITLCLKASIISGLLAFWQLYDLVAKTNWKATILDQWMGFSFFLYAFHEPFFTIIKKAFFAMLPKTPLSYFIVYCITPVIIIGIALLLGKFLKDKMKPFYGLITGNR